MVTAMTGKAILGISAYYHDSAAALVVDGRIVAAAQEERFTRKKQDSRFPTHAVEYCLREGGIGLGEVQSVVFYDKPLAKFSRLMQTYLAFAPRGFPSFSQALPVWMKDKLHVRSSLARGLAAVSGLPEAELPQVLFSEHHLSHAASAFYPGPFSRALVLCLDGVGEWATTSAWLGDGTSLTPLWQVNFPHSLGLLYSAFTYYCGFKVDSGEYKLMGLAPYGVPRYRDVILSKLIDLKDDGTFRLDMAYFNFATGLTMTNDRFARLFGGPRREPESPLTQREMDLAASIQLVTEEVVLRLGRTLHRETGERYLCLAGGVALNCVANGRLLREGPFEDIWVQPAAGDAGGALGAALVAHYETPGVTRAVSGTADAMQGSYLGPAYTDEEIMRYLQSVDAPYYRLDESDLLEYVAELLAEGKVIGWFQGRMEFGPRALGSRSIIGDPRSRSMQTTMNLKIKFRESFRPFAPSVLAEHVSDWFGLDRPSPYMLIVAPVADQRRLPVDHGYENLFGIAKLNVARSTIPAITHVDYSARIQTVHRETNPRFHGLLTKFFERTGCPMVVNSSFNVRGEPIVESPSDAYRCFMRTEMDCLVMGNCVLLKDQQPVRETDTAWKEEFALD
ncbi:carbamoyltransferase [Paraburkholderia fungorum]|jgi:carbamoyltransferase|uniref:Carbamoyltransferase n=5 Tax=Bacteria TaxID=2 RepID=B2T0W5_PARPJ|nr:Carbamoyltransferase [Paraburkholderia phytofirmans PsJN]PRZ55766.1 carbamoyltransferase [Paraburkholderia fungorum]